MVISEETKKFIIEHVDDDVFTLGFHASHYPDVDMHIAVVQIEGRQKAKTKLPTWYANTDIVYPPHLALEQCSSERTALYKSSLVKGAQLVDLTGGLGVDFSFLSRHFERAIYVEHQEELCGLAAHNFEALGLSNIETINADSVDYLREMGHIDVVYIDPARRDRKGGKVAAISDCEPNLLEIIDVLREKADCILVKLSPMLDLYAAMQQLGGVAEVHVVSVGNECKELLLLLKTGHTEPPVIHCVNMGKVDDQQFVFTREEEVSADIAFASQPATFLYEPNASVLKAGAFKTIAVRFGVNKLHPNSHLYTSDRFVNDFPGKIFRVKEYSSFNKKDVHNFLGGLKKANISVRNFPMTAVDLHKRFHLADGGEDFLYATTLGNDQHMLILCEKVYIKD